MFWEITIHLNFVKIHLSYVLSTFPLQIFLSHWYTRSTTQSRKWILIRTPIVVPNAFLAKMFFPPKIREVISKLINRIEESRPWSKQKSEKYRAKHEAWNVDDSFVRTLKIQRPMLQLNTNYLFQCKLYVTNRILLCENLSTVCLRFLSKYFCDGFVGHNPCRKMLFFLLFTEW